MVISLIVGVERLMKGKYLLEGGKTANPPFWQAGER